VAGRGLADGQLPTVAGAGLLPRGYAWACWKEGAEANPMVAAPLLKGRRSLLAGEAERQSSRTNGAVALQGARERAMMLWRFSGSPGVR
jgi:hypothetical protein